jgi:hypothetical protein
MVVQACNPCISEAQSEGLQVQGQPGLNSEIMSQKNKERIIFELNTLDSS